MSDEEIAARIIEEMEKVSMLSHKLFAYARHATAPDYSCAAIPVEVIEERRLKKLPERLELIRKARYNLEITFNLLREDCLADIKRENNG